MDAFKKVALVQWTPELQNALYWPDLSPFGPLSSAQDVLNGCSLYQYLDQQQAAYVAVRVVPLAGGNRLDVIGALSTGATLDGPEFTAAVEQIARAHNATYIGLLTKIPQIAKKCVDCGFEITGAVLLKKVSNV